ncbi:MAG: hypothetical protein RLZZ546_2907 [Bacteroidota bacterium]|jgi:hypothetical protein
MSPEIKEYNHSYSEEDKNICMKLATIIESALPYTECKIWHSHPVWFIEGNPIVGYSKQIAGIRLMFWSGADFKVEELNVIGKKFKDASIFYNLVSEIDETKLKNWLKKSAEIQWDYKNIVKRKGQLIKIK